jgi:Flp pilus assembly protein TadD
MALARDSLILTLVLLTAPSLAAVPHQAPRARAEAAASGDAAADFIRQAQAAAAKGDKELAIRLAQSAIVAAPARTAPYDALGDLYAAQGDSDFARFYYNEALSIDPTDAIATKALSALDQGDSQRDAKAEPPAK